MAEKESNTGKTCAESGCNRTVNARGLCLMHYKRARNAGKFVIVKPAHPETCVADDCHKKSVKRGYCDTHYRRIQRYGTLETVRQKPGGLVRMGGGYLTQRIDGEIKLHHVRVVEAVLGVNLPKGVEIHHVNEITSDNRHENLVVCQDRAYHMLLHVRQRALDECGNANWKKCIHCKQYDDPINLGGKVRDGQKVNSFYHRHCAAAYVRLGKARRKAAAT